MGWIEKTLHHYRWKNPTKEGEMKGKNFIFGRSQFEGEKLINIGYNFLM